LITFSFKRWSELGGREGDYASLPVGRVVRGEMKVSICVSWLLVYTDFKSSVIRLVEEGVQEWQIVILLLLHGEQCFLRAISGEW